MKVRWNALLVRSILWLSLEVMLGSLGVDTLADYSEFLMDVKRGNARQGMVY